METGKLNDRIRIYEPKAGMNLTSLDDYELAGSVWANVRAVTTRDQIHSGIDVQSGQLTILIRYVTGLSDDCLIEWNGRFFGIDNPKFPVVFGNYSLKGVASDYSFFLIISAFFEHYLFQF